MIELNAIAVVAYNRITKKSSEAQADFLRELKWNVKVFENRDEALAWLKSENLKSNKAN